MDIYRADKEQLEDIKKTVKRKSNLEMCDRVSFLRVDEAGEH